MPRFGLQLRHIRVGVLPDKPPAKRKRIGEDNSQPVASVKLTRMASHPLDCELCARIAQIKRGESPNFVAELETGYVMLGDSQYFRGYTLFLCKEPAPDLEDLPWPTRLQFLTELALVSQAVANVTAPHKMNLESLGNMVPHLHWHLFPRRLSEPEPTKPVWLVMPDAAQSPNTAFNADNEADVALREALAREIETLRSSRV